jgi:dTMP kinase
LSDSGARGAPLPEGGERRGLFIVVEGVEGAGKTTQVSLLLDWLRAQGVPAVRAREPGGTPVGEAVREVLLERRELDVGPESELLLMLAARAAFVRDVVAPALREGKVMVSDRFDFSTFAYQGYGRGLPLDRIRVLNDFATGGLRPDLVLVLDLPAGQGRARQIGAGKEEDRIEAAGVDFLDRVAAGYRTLGAEEPHARLVDATPEVEVVQEALRRILVDHFPEPLGAGRGSTTTEPYNPRTDAP